MCKRRRIMKFKMIHENYNVSDLDRSIKFYNEALDLHEVRRKTTDDFIIVYLSNDVSDFELELTWLKDHPFYGDWIKGYVSEEYVACNQSILDTVDRLGEHCSEADIAHLKDIFRTCSRFEAFFWDMAWNMAL